MPGVKVTNVVKLAAMFLLARRPQHGYDIIKAVGAQLGRPVSAGQVYPFLEQLRRAGYTRVRETGVRDRKQYVLTPSGSRFVRKLFATFGTMVEAVVERRLTVCAHCGCEIYRGGYARRGRMFCCPACAGSGNQPKVFKPGRKKGQEQKHLQEM